MAAKFAVVFALCFVAAVAADGIYSDNQYGEIDSRVNKCISSIGSINGQSFDRPGDACKSLYIVKLLEEPITKEVLSDRLAECLAERKSDIGEEKFNTVTKCLKEELSKPLGGKRGSRLFSRRG